MENLIITIGRQLGSGGRQIGRQLAEQLNIAFYDKELINIAAQKSGLSKEIFEQADEKKKHSLLGSRFDLHANFMSGDYQVNSCLCDESLFQIQSDVIRSLSEQQSCVFVGRCADYILREHPCCLNIFFSADMEDRMQNVSGMMQLSPEKAKEFIRQTDKNRAAYYNYYTNKKWGVAKSYHLCLNSSLLGASETIAYIIHFIKVFKTKKMT